MVSGSAVANVVATGSFTIPMMKRVGYRPHVAGAIEALSVVNGFLVTSRRQSTVARPAVG